MVDTAGAGDTFTAGFLSECAYSRDIAARLERNARAAADAVTGVRAFEAPATPWNQECVRLDVGLAGKIRQRSD